MTRKKLLNILGLSLTGLGWAHAKTHTSQREMVDFLENFLPKWKRTGEYNLAVMDAMPEAHYDFSPVPDQMAFGKQLTHAAYWTSFLFGTFVGRDHTPEVSHINKQEAMAYVDEVYSEAYKILKELDPALLGQKDLRSQSAFWARHTGQDFILRAYMHTAHHRGQAVVYLRIKGIQAPRFTY